jgi:hypothetical protein
MLGFRPVEICLPDLSVELIGNTLEKLFPRLVTNQLDKNSGFIENLARFHVWLSLESITVSYARDSEGG